MLHDPITTRLLQVTSFIRDHTIKPFTTLEALGSSVAAAVLDSKAKLVVCESDDGELARLVSKYRPMCPVLVVTTQAHVVAHTVRHWDVECCRRSSACLHLL